MASVKSQHLIIIIITATSFSIKITVQSLVVLIVDSLEVHDH